MDDATPMPTPAADPTPLPPTLTRGLLVANVLVFGATWLAAWSTGIDLRGLLALWPLSTGEFRPWQLATYAFAHADFGHLFFNMLGLAMCGAAIEGAWGARRLAVLYAVSVLAAALAQLLVTAATGSDAPTIGASGGVFGLLLAFGMLFPQRRLIVFPIPIPLPARVFVALYGLVELVLGVTGEMSDVAHFAHLGGLVGGWIVWRRWRDPAAA